MSNIFKALSEVAATVTQFIETGNNLVNTIQSSKALETVTNNIIKQSEPPESTDPERSFTEVAIDANPNNKVPVLYGRGITYGIKVDAHLDSDDVTLWVCYVLSEKTGVKIDQTPSQTNFLKVFMDGYECEFDTDGVSVTAIKDTLIVPNRDTRMAGNIQVYCYNDGVTNQVFPSGYTGTAQNAYDVWPTWTIAKQFDGLVFAIVKVTYDATNDITALPEFSFDLQNTMDQPGDVLYDYLTNTRYGAGIPESEIFVS